MKATLAHWHRRLERGSIILEAALVFPLLLMAAIGLVQFALFEHAQNVVTGAVQDGARVASSEDGTLAEGVDYAKTILAAGLGPTAGQIQVQGLDGGDAIAIQAQGQLHMIFPWIADATLPLQARSVVSKERFRAGPNG